MRAGRRPTASCSTGAGRGSTLRARSSTGTCRRPTSSPWPAPAARRRAARSALHLPVEGGDQPLEVDDLPLEHGAPEFGVPLRVELFGGPPLLLDPREVLQVVDGLPVRVGQLPEVVDRLGATAPAKSATAAFS